MADSRGGINRVSLNYASSIRDGDELRNINSYEYLKYLVEAIPEKFVDYQQRFGMLIKLQSFFAENPDYNPEIPYGNIYSHFLKTFEDSIQTQLNLKNQTEGLNAILFISEVIKRIYENDNHALERSAKMIESVVVAPAEGESPKIERRVHARILGGGHFSAFSNYINFFTGYRNVNELTPQSAGSKMGRLTTLMSSNFDTLSSTSMPSILRYHYKTRGMPTQIRMGSQAQRVDNIPTTNPLLRAFLKVKAINKPAQSMSANSMAAAAAMPSSSSASVADHTAYELEPVSIRQDVEAPILSQYHFTHVYINNLGLDRTGIEGSNEKALTEELHKLETIHPNVAIITLPADKGLFNETLSTQRDKSISYQHAMAVMLAIATGSKLTPPDMKFPINDSLAKPLGLSSKEIRDFHISKNVKAYLYGKDRGREHDKQIEENSIRLLLSKSFRMFGFKEDSILSPSEFQIVYFHFIKFELTDYILKRLNPETFNITCKDGIDRGGISSAYYNLMKSIECGNPMSKDEFFRAIHAAPAMVKGRGMNHHIIALWNIIDAYVDTHPDLVSNAGINWLIEWRDNNLPENSKKYLVAQLNKYIETRPREASGVGGVDKETKIAAAIVVKNLINGILPTSALNNDIWGALHQGRLGDLITKLEKSGVVNLEPYTPVIAAQPVLHRPSS